MKLARLLKHLCIPHWIALRAFPNSVLRQIQHAIAASEKRHVGELRFAVEGPLHVADVLRSLTPRARAEQLFGQLGVWDTAHNSGVLIYVQLVDRRIEIVADRGIAAKVPQTEWNAICRAMEASFRERRFAEGALAAIARITALLATHFPATGANPNELPDKPTVL
jgi:uncharacterized membrane protein